MAEAGSTQSDLQYRVGSEAECAEMVDLVVDTFLESEPLALSVGLTAEELKVFVALLTRHVVGQGLCMVARWAKSGELAGVLLTEDSATPLPGGIESVSPKCQPIFALLGQLNAEYWGERCPRPGESAHLYMLAVPKRNAGQGIGQRLVLHCVDHAAQRGYRMAVVEATSRNSQHIFGKQGFTARVRGSYRDFRWEGKAIFTNFAEQGGPWLMDRIWEREETVS